MSIRSNRKAANNPMYGLTHSAETRAKMSQTSMNRVMSKLTLCSLNGENVYYKTCTKCGESKLMNENNFYHNKNIKSGWAPVCRFCHQKLGRIHWEEKKRAQKFNMPADGYEQMMAVQDNKCAICLKPNMVLCVDHSHETGQVRGLLCRKCNTAIAFLDESILTIMRAANYIAKFKGLDENKEK